MFKHGNTMHSFFFKLALVSTAVGASCAAPAQAAFTSTAPANFAPLTFTQADLASYALDLDLDGVADFTITSGHASDFGEILLNGVRNGSATDTYFNGARGYADPKDFIAPDQIRAMQNAAVIYGGLTPATAYAELVFVSNHDVLARGYINGYTTIADHKGNFTLLDFGLAPEAAVPEPGSLALLAAGAAAIWARRRRRPVRAS